MNRLKELRKSKNLSQAEIATMLEVGQTTYSGWELNKFEIDFTNLKKLAEFYNVSIDYILGFEPTEQQRSVINEVYEFAKEIGITNDTIKNMTPQRKAELQQIINILCNKTQDK